MPSGSFTIDARILGERWRHHRLHDHTGADSDLYVVLSADIPGYVAYTPVHAVLDDMVARLLQLENNTRVFDSFSIDAAITDRVFTIDAAIKGTIESSFTVDAIIANVKSFTVDARIVGRFTINAFIV